MERGKRAKELCTGLGDVDIQPDLHLHDPNGLRLGQGQHERVQVAPLQALFWLGHHVVCAHVDLFVVHRAHEPVDKAVAVGVDVVAERFHHHKLFKHVLLLQHRLVDHSFEQNRFLGRFRAEFLEHLQHLGLLGGLVACDCGLQSRKLFALGGLEFRQGVFQRRPHRRAGRHRGPSSARAHGNVDVALHVCERGDVAFPRERRAARPREVLGRIVVGSQKPLQVRVVRVEKPLAVHWFLLSRLPLRLQNSHCACPDSGVGLERSAPVQDWGNGGLSSLDFSVLLLYRLA